MCVGLCCGAALTPDKGPAPHPVWGGTERTAHCVPASPTTCPWKTPTCPKSKIQNCVPGAHVCPIRQVPSLSSRFQRLNSRMRARQVFPLCRLVWHKGASLPTLLVEMLDAGPLHNEGRVRAVVQRQTSCVGSMKSLPSVCEGAGVVSILRAEADGTSPILGMGGTGGREGIDDSPKDVIRSGSLVTVRVRGNIGVRACG